MYPPLNLASGVPFPLPSPFCREILRVTHCSPLLFTYSLRSKWLWKHGLSYMKCQRAGNVFFAELLIMCATNTHTQGLLAVAICQVWRLDFNVLVPGLAHILSCLLQVLPQQRIFLLEFRKKSKSLVLLFHLLLSAGLGRGGHGSFCEYTLSHPVPWSSFQRMNGLSSRWHLTGGRTEPFCPRWATLSFEIPKWTVCRESCRNHRSPESLCTNPSGLPGGGDNPFCLGYSWKQKC